MKKINAELLRVLKLSIKILPSCNSQNSKQLHHCTKGKETCGYCEIKHQAQQAVKDAEEIEKRRRIIQKKVTVTFIYNVMDGKKDEYYKDRAFGDIYNSYDVLNEDAFLVEDWEDKSFEQLKKDNKMKLIIDTCPNDEDFYAIWTDVSKAINCTVAKGIGDKEDAEIILKALQNKYNKIKG